MSPKERIMTIRLMEKLQKYPEYGKVLGLECVVLKATGKEEKT